MKKEVTQKVEGKKKKSLVRSVSTSIVSTVTFIYLTVKIFRLVSSSIKMFKKLMQIVDYFNKVSRFIKFVGRVFSRN